MREHRHVSFKELSPMFRNLFIGIFNPCNRVLERVCWSFSLLNPRKNEVRGVPEHRFRRPDAQHAIPYSFDAFFRIVGKLWIILQKAERLPRHGRCALNLQVRDLREEAIQ